MYIFWAILGIVFLYIDFIKKSKISLTLAMTFLFCATVAFKFPENYLYQVFSFLSFFMLFHFLITTSFKKESDDLKKIDMLDEFVGKSAVVTKDIGKTFSIDGLGMIKFKKQFWSAKSIDDKEIKAGKRVEIISRENKIMNVKVIQNAKK